MRPRLRPLLLTAALLAGAAGLALAPAAIGQGDREPAIKILGPQGRLNFEIRPREACESFAEREISIRFRGHGVTRTFTLDDPCGKWKGSSRSAPSVRFSFEDGTSKSAARLKARTVGSEEVERRFSYTIRIGGKTKDRGVMRAEIREDDGDVERYLYLDD